jgi:ornithine carbamoyltransferase
VAHSLLLAGAAVGASVRVATPEGYQPAGAVVAAAQKIAAGTGGSVLVTHHPHQAVRDADAVYTDVWASMGQEEQAAQRARLFAPYQVNEKLMAGAGAHAVFMHCLPAHRGDEVSAGVIDSPRSIVYDQAENRLHIQKAILLWLLGDDMHRFAARSTHA